MENIGAATARAAHPGVAEAEFEGRSDAEFDLEFDALVANWSAERWAAEYGDYDEAQDCLDALLEARAVKASAEAREQQCLARLEAIALESADRGTPRQSDASSRAREIAWRSMAAEIAVATHQADRTVQAMMGRATALVHDLPAVLDALACGRISFAHARVILEHAIGMESDAVTRQAKAVAATGDPRTRDQLRSDLATDLLLTGEPAVGEDAPHSAAGGIRAEVSIMIPALTLLGHGNEPATLAGRGPIDLDTACRLSREAPELVRVLTHPVIGTVIAADTYRPTASLRRYLAARDRHCRFPSCNRDARWCDIDHTIAWEDGGTSTPDNLAHLCRGHHTIKHHGGWSLRQTSPGVLEWTSPRGRTITVHTADDASPPGPQFRPEGQQSEHEPPPF